MPDQNNNMGVREFKFFHGVTIQTEGIQNIVEHYEHNGDLNWLMI